MSKRILITGASRGIGRAIAEQLADSDVTLLLHGRDTVALAATCQAVQSRCAGVVKLIHDLFAGQMPPGSSIVNILSIAAQTGFANWSAYCMSKFALEGFSQSVRDELREHRIRMINIYPAATNTEIWNDVEGDWSREKMISAEQVASAVAYALSRPENVAVENITLSNAAGNL